MLKLHLLLLTLQNILVFNPTTNSLNSPYFQKLPLFFNYYEGLVFAAPNPNNSSSFVFVILSLLCLNYHYFSLYFKTTLIFNPTANSLNNPYFQQLPLFYYFCKGWFSEQRIQMFPHLSYLLIYYYYA